MEVLNVFHQCMYQVLQLRMMLACCWIVKWQWLQLEVLSSLVVTSWSWELMPHIDVVTCCVPDWIPQSCHWRLWSFFRILLESGSCYQHTLKSTQEYTWTYTSAHNSTYRRHTHNTQQAHKTYTTHNMYIHSTQHTTCTSFLAHVTRAQQVPFSFLEQTSHPT